MDQIRELDLEELQVDDSPGGDSEVELSGEHGVLGWNGVGEEHAVLFLGCAPAPIIEGRRKRQKWERGVMSGAWWGKNKKKGREEGTWVVGEKRGKKKKK